VQAIKNNPRTATIPILMYTSQEGELYLGQARALGAVGVLPKQIKPTDVSKVLYQLHLVADRRTGEQSTFKEVNLQAVDNEAPGAPPPGSKPLTDTALREQFAELRRALVASIDTQSERITSDVRLLLQDAMPSFAPTRAPESRTPWVLASVALIIALASAGLWWHEARLRQDLVAELAELKRAALAAPAATDGPAPGAESGPGFAPSDEAGADGTGEVVPQGVAGGNRASGATSLEDRKVITIPVPYGEDALSGPRLEMIRQIMRRLAARDVRGVVEVRTFAGRYCLVGNATEGFSVAPDELTYSRCIVANPHEDSLPLAQRESLGFANLAGEFRAETHGALDLQLSTGDATAVTAAYPSTSGSLTAGEWNKAAAANNRIEVRLR
jgi:CheY-like chemotaxis protein